MEGSTLLNTNLNGSMEKLKVLMSDILELKENPKLLLKSEISRIIK